MLVPTKLAQSATILHVIAAFADARTMKILSDAADLLRLDPESRNDEGLTARDVFDQRKTVNAELRDAFHHLVNGIAGMSDRSSYSMTGPPNF